MIKNTQYELLIRLIIIIISAITIASMSIIFSNEIIIAMLYPIKEIHNDWHNKIIFNIINNSYNIFDNEEIKQTQFFKKKIDYIPSCEISIKTGNMSIIIFKIGAHIATIITICFVLYHSMIGVNASLYKKEKKEMFKKSTCLIIIILISILMTHSIWTKLYMNMSWNNYQEYNYFEFDVDFDINNYITKYIIATYAHIIMIHFKKSNITYISLIIMMNCNVIGGIELLYYLLIIKCCSEYTFIYAIFNKKRQNQNKLEQQKQILFLKQMLQNKLFYLY